MDDRLTDKIRSFKREQGNILFMYLLAIYKVFVSGEGVTVKADYFSKFAGKEIDGLITNSVIQYFSS